MRTLNQKILDAIHSGKDQRALDILYKKVLPKIKSYILKNSGDVEDAKDIFQDTVLIFYNKVKQHQFDANYEIDGYMFTIARNLWIKKTTRDQRMKRMSDNTEHWAEEDINGFIISKEKMYAINQLFEKLGEPCKTLLHHSIFEELSLKEIVQKMNYASINVAKTYTYRCRKKLADLIDSKKGFKQLFDL